MTDLDMILTLLKEVDAELTYNRDFAKEKARAENAAERNEGKAWVYGKYMNAIYDHDPRKRVILDDLKMVRRLCLKICKKVEASRCGY